MSDYYNEIYVGNKPGSEQIYTHAETINNKEAIANPEALKFFENIPQLK